MPKFLKLAPTIANVRHEIININNISYTQIDAMTSAGVVTLALGNGDATSGDSPTLLTIAGGIDEAQKVVDAIWNAKISPVKSYMFTVPNQPNITAVSP
tara:strand:- start:6162 stop:6458 length:297 start_codon:yes stop_codon:yes gene_type:complete